MTISMMPSISASQPGSAHFSGMRSMMKQLKTVNQDSINLNKDKKAAKEQQGLFEAIFSTPIIHSFNQSRAQNMLRVLVN